MTIMLASISSCSILALLFANQIKGLESYNIILLVIAFSSTGALLIKMYQFILANENPSQSELKKRVIRSHVFLHCIPLNYLLLHELLEPSLLVILFFYILNFAFFATGLQMWQFFFKSLNSKIFLIFYKGNTGMLIGPTLLLIFGLMLGEGDAYYNRAMTGYFISHFLLTGITMVKIEKDLMTCKLLVTGEFK